MKPEIKRSIDSSIKEFKRMFLFPEDANVDFSDVADGAGDSIVYAVYAPWTCVGYVRAHSASHALILMSMLREDVDIYMNRKRYLAKPADMQWLKQKASDMEAELEILKAAFHCVMMTDVQIRNLRRLEVWLRILADGHKKYEMGLIDMAHDIEIILVSWTHSRKTLDALNVIIEFYNKLRNVKVTDLPDVVISSMMSEYRMILAK